MKDNSCVGCVYDPAITSVLIACGHPEESYKGFYDRPTESCYKGRSNPIKELKAIIFSLADTIEDISDAEIIEEIKQCGGNPEIIAEEVRNVLLAAVNVHLRRQR